MTKQRTCAGLLLLISLLFGSLGYSASGSCPEVFQSQFKIHIKVIGENSAWLKPRIESFLFETLKGFSQKVGANLTIPTEPLSIALSAYGTHLDFSWVPDQKKNYSDRNAVLNLVARYGLPGTTGANPIGRTRPLWVHEFAHLLLVKNSKVLSKVLMQVSEAERKSSMERAKIERTKLILGGIQELFADMAAAIDSQDGQAVSRALQLDQFPLAKRHQNRNYSREQVSIDGDVHTVFVSAGSRIWAAVESRPELRKNPGLFLKLLVKVIDDEIGSVENAMALSDESIAALNDHIVQKFLMETSNRTEPET